MRNFFRYGATSLGLVAIVASCDPGLGDLSNGGPVPSTSGAEAGAGDGGSNGGREGGSLTDGAGVDGFGGGPGTDGGGSCNGTDGGPGNVGSMCRQSADCCTGACSESHRCASMCLAEGAGGCDPQGTTCCSGDYCSVAAGAQCKACIDTGSAPESVDGVVNERSCCSRHASMPMGGGPLRCSSDSGSGG